MTACAASALGKSTTRLALTGMGLLAVTSWGVTHLFSGRGAFIEFGVLTGTVMVGNVFFVIIPNQRKVIGALIAGQSLIRQTGYRRQEAFDL